VACDPLGMSIGLELPEGLQLSVPTAPQGVKSGLSTPMPRPNLISLFNSFPRCGNDVAVVEKRGYRREMTTYLTLHSNAVAWSQRLAREGIEPGDRVLLWGPNSGAWIACFWGLLLRGAVAVPMDAAASLEFVGRTMRSAAVKLILRDASQPVLPGDTRSVVFNDVAGPMDLSASSGAVVQHSMTPAADTIAEILFTSGTTGEPRGVVLTHGNFLANLEPLERGIDPYRRYERWFHPLRFVSMVPLSHVFGQFMTLFVPPLLGATVVFEPSNNPSDVIRTARQERATAIIAVPRMLDAIRAEIERDIEARHRSVWFQHAYDAANGQKFLPRAWRFRRIHRRFGWKFWAFISGGAALAADTEDFLKRLGYAVVQGYGMTETASLISLNHPFRATQGSIGKVLPGREFKLAEDGEILVRGKNVSVGYWEGGEFRPSDERGWLRTGDLGELDAEGNLRFRGRKKNVIVTPAGLNVFPEDLEQVLRKQRGVRDSVVVPIERSGNAEPCGVLLLRDSSRPGAREIVEAANRELAEYQRMSEWLVWPDVDFPRTPTGKPRLAEIRVITAQLLSAGSARASSSGEATAPSGTSPILSELLSRFSRHRSADSTHLEQEIALSSLDRVELLSALEQKFHVELSETSFAEAKTVADVQRLLEQPSARRREYRYPRWAQFAPVRWFRLAVYYTLVWPATQILGHPRIFGRDNLRDLRGPVLVASNHITRRADIGLIMLSLPMRFRHRLAIAMGGETLQEMRHPPREWFVLKRWSYKLGYWLVTALFNVFPLPQVSGFRETFRFAGESVDRGYSVLIFPEGVVNDSTTGEMAPFRSGVGLLATNLRIPIVPVRLDGIWNMKRQHRRLAHFREITVHIGKPILFPPNTAPQTVASELQAVVKSL
jgi:long-chain acyl-CoA synthetase